MLPFWLLQQKRRYIKNKQRIHGNYNLKFSIFSLLFFCQSVEVFDYVRKDFDEFSQTVQEEVSSASTAIKEKLKVNILSILSLCQLKSKKKILNSYFRLMKKMELLPLSSEVSPHSSIRFQMCFTFHQRMTTSLFFSIA